MVSTYLFRLVHCHQPLHTCSPGGPHASYMTFPQCLWYRVFEGQSRSPPTSLTTHFSFIILSSLIRSTCPNQLSTFFFILTVTSSLVPAILCIASLRIQSAKLTPHILRRDSPRHSSFLHSSSVIPTFCCRLTASVPTLHCVRPNTLLCWRFAVTSMQLRLH